MYIAVTSEYLILGVLLAQINMNYMEFCSFCYYVLLHSKGFNRQLLLSLHDSDIIIIFDNFIVIISSYDKAG